MTHCCSSGSCAFVVSRPVSPVPSASPVLVGGVGGSRVGFGVGVARGGVEGGLSHCLHFSAREMGGGAAPGSTNSWSDTCLRGGGRGKFSAGWRCTGAGCRFHSQEAIRHRYQACQGRCGHTFLHPEVPGIQSVSPGYGLDIKQSMCWTKVCETARSGIWVLKGIARTCMSPANLDHLRVEWRKRGT